MDGAKSHRLRPLAYRSFQGLLRDRLFAQSDAEVTGAAAEIRHPFVDLRVLRYMLAVPAVPWCDQKYLLRRAMRGVLPPPVSAPSQVAPGRNPAMGGHFALGAVANAPRG